MTQAVLLENSFKTKHLVGIDISRILGCITDRDWMSFTVIQSGHDPEN